MLSRFLLLAAALCAPSLLADQPQTFWRVSGGAAYRQLGGLHWNTVVDSPAYLFQLTGPDSLGGPAGSVTSAANRSYINGYVNIDGNTATNGTTWFWGYNDNAQLQGDSLFFQTAPGAYNQTESQLTSGDWTDSHPDGFGPLLQVEWVRRITPNLCWSALGGLFFTQFNSDHVLSNFSAVNTTASLVDRYDLGGVILPSAPYAGDLTGPGPSISNVPSKRSPGHDASTTTYQNQVSQSFDLNLFTFSFGPTIEWHRNRLGLQASAGFALNIASWEAEQRESLSANGRTIAEWVYRESRIEALAGAFVQASVFYALRRDWHVSAFLRYDWSHGIDERVGPSLITVDLNAFSVGVMIGKTF